MKNEELYHKPEKLKFKHNFRVLRFFVIFLKLMLLRGSSNV